jgi:hypothetical protein
VTWYLLIDEIGENFAQAAKTSEVRRFRNLEAKVAL